MILCSVSTDRNRKLDYIVGYIVQRITRCVFSKKEAGITVRTDRFRANLDVVLTSFPVYVRQWNGNVSRTNSINAETRLPIEY